MFVTMVGNLIPGEGEREGGGEKGRGRGEGGGEKGRGRGGGMNKYIQTLLLSLAITHLNTLYASTM